MILKVYNKVKEYFIPIVLVMFIVSESIAKYREFILGDDKKLWLAAALKGLVLLFCIAHLIKWNKLTRNIIAIVLIYLIGQLGLNPNFENTVNANFVKYLFPLILLGYVSKNKLQEHVRVKLFLLFEWIILINSALIIIGYIGNVYWFKTYLGPRFGFNGLFITSATSTYFYLIALCYMAFSYKEKMLYSLKPLFVLISCVLIGTKSIWIATLLVLIYGIVLMKSNRNRGIAIGLFVIIFSASYYLIFMDYNLFHKIKAESSLLTAILSYRNTLLQESLLPFVDANWSFVNYIFGGINDVKTRSQMAFIDLLYFFGLLGSILYLQTYYLSFRSIRTKSIINFFTILILGVAFISGNFFLNASAAIYIVVYREILIEKDKRTVINQN